MDAVKEYLLRVIAAAFLCAIVNAIMQKNSAIGGISKFLTGIFMALALVSPILNLQIPSADSFFQNLDSEAAIIAAESEKSAYAQMSSIIKEKTETYILNKAEALSAKISVDVCLSSNDLPVPIAVRMTGSISPYAKKSLSGVLEDELGIPPEAQIWN